MIKSYRNLSVYDKDKIVEFYYKNKEYNFSELANLLNVSKRSISRVLNERNINTKRKNRYILNESYFNNIDSEEKAYILGLIYADGFVGDDKFNNIVITSIDLDILEKIKKEFEFTGEIRKGNKGNFKNSKEGYVLNFSSQEMSNDLRKIGLHPNKSLTMECLPKLNEKLLRHFIRGYFDGDGSVILSHNTSYHIVDGKNKKYEYPTFSFDLLGTEKFLLEIKEVMKLKHHKLLNTKTEGIKRLVCRSKKEAKDIFKYLYFDSSIYMNRKYEKWNYVLSAFAK